MSKTMRNISAGAVILLGITSASAFAAQDYDPAKAFIERLAGKQVPVVDRLDPPARQTDENPAQDFLDRLAGKLRRPTQHTSAGVNRSHSDPAQDFIARVAGRQR